MPSNYPGSLDSLSNPAGTDTLNNPSHSSQHTNANDAIEAIESALGANLSKAPGYEMDFVQRTTDAAITATTEATANTLITGNSVTYDGSTTVEIVFSCTKLRLPGGVAATMDVWLYEDGSSIGSMAHMMNVSVNAFDWPVVARRRITPSAGAHTYSIRASVSTATGFLGAGTGVSGAQGPAIMTIRRV